MGNVKLSRRELVAKREELVKVRAALDHKYQQLGGQIEMIDDMLGGKLGVILENGG